mgnify:CR=1 FL=1
MKLMYIIPAMFAMPMAKAANVIYQHSFSGTSTANLGGTALDTTTNSLGGTSGAAWVSSTRFKADGSIATTDAAGSAFVAFSPQYGNIYSISVDTRATPRATTPASHLAYVGIALNSHVGPTPETTTLFAAGHRSLSPIARSPDDTPNASNTTNPKYILRRWETTGSYALTADHIPTLSLDEGVWRLTIELDTTAGRWYKVEQKDLDSGKSGKYKKNMDSINDFRKKIKDLTANLEKAQKDYKEAEEKYNESVRNSKGKGKGGNNETVSDKERNNAKSKVDGINAQIKEFLDKIDKARDEIGYGSKESGIYTYWANENLRLTVKNVTEPGWYTLRIVAKNYKGNLPAWYKQFNVTVQNETEDVEVGGISIHASDSKYFRGALDVFLDEGDTDLNLLWTNDAYIENSYDANINIKRVTLKWAQKSNKKMRRLVRNAHEYTTVDGRFFWDNNSAWTYWQDQTLGFSFPNLEAGKYEITIMGKNYGELPLPADYEYFTIAVDADGTSAQAQVPAAMKGWRKGTVVLDITGGTDIMLTWLNDSWKENEYDANFQFKKIMLKRVDESDRSALAAYLLGTKSGNRVLMSGVLLALIGLIAMISLWNRGRAKKQA